ncbi:hypothetical protein [Polaribacter glomeratus]|nr:hypothetical protein [Polaribacter glomeratus]TXD65094.1 hypothetical protein ESX12_11490 [Polaribacter glomeratus]
MMKTRQITITLLFLTILVSKAQVKDISFTLSPAAEYTWWDNKAGFEDNLFVGGKLGFGFGEFVELRAIYLQSLDLKTNFKDFGIAGYDDALFNSQNVTVTRWGGEFKANFGTKGIRPYLTLGAGVQNINPENSGDFEQVYGSLGLGTKFKLSDRIVFSLEAKNTTYRFNSGMHLLSDGNKTDFGVTDADFENERLTNWSLQGSLQFYLGGRRPGILSELDEAYLQRFKGGFKGLQWVIEPGLAYTDFDSSSLFRDTYWLGGFAGLDLNEYIGIRAFYFQATQNENISTDFDKMAMYGGEFRARLNDGNGVTPFLILGGGYLSPGSDYMPMANADGSFSVLEGGEFATGGLGLNIPLGKHVLISGGARAMITSGENVADIVNTDDIQTHIFYNAGLKFTLGAKSKAPNTVYRENLDREISVQQTISSNKIAQLKQDYQSKIQVLENDLKEAYKAKDVDKAVQILEEKKQVTKSLGEVEAVEEVQQQKEAKVMATTSTKTSEKEAVKKVENTVEKSRLIQMSPEQFETLIQRIINNLDESTTSLKKKDTITPSKVNESIKDEKIEQLNKRVEVLEKLLLELNAKQAQGTTKLDNNTSNDVNEKQQVDKMNGVILDKIDVLNKKIDTNKNQTVLVEPTIETEREVTINTFANESLLVYNSFSTMVGFNYGGASTANFGVRLHYDVIKTKIEFMPELYLGFGESSTWALSGNFVHPISIGSDKYKPYAGAGLGFGNLVNGATGFYNMIIGTKLPVLHKNLYIDYTMRNSFKYNQIAIGYNLKF